MNALAALAAAWLAAGATDRATADELSRVRGHDIELTAEGSLAIRSIAGEGQPLIGWVKRVGPSLVLTAPGVKDVTLRGPLAIPRIAGPAYKVWALGERRGDELWVRRLGVLRRPR